MPFSSSDELNDYIRYEHQLHNWIRILGAFGQAYIPATPDHGHYNLEWSPTSGVIETRTIKKGSDYAMIYDPVKQSLGLLLNDLTVTSIGDNTKTWEELLDAAEQVLQAEGFDISQFRSLVEVRYPDLLDPAQLNDDTLSKTIEVVRHYAHEALDTLLNESGHPYNEIRVWPHNFDTGIFIQHPNGYSQYAGYTPADEEVCDMPYFYNSFYSGNEQVIPSPPTNLSRGHWETEKKWIGAVLPLNEIGDFSELETNATEFFRESTTAMSGLWK